MRCIDREPTDLGTSKRGQTTQDFVIGIGLFLLAMAFVFSFVPSLMVPFSPTVGSADIAQAERIGSTVLDDVNDDPDQPNHVNVTLFEDRYVNASMEELADLLGLRHAGDAPFDRVNITLESLEATDDDPILTAGSTYDDEASATVVRIVSVEAVGDTGLECTPACRLTVRVW